MNINPVFLDSMRFDLSKIDIDNFVDLSFVVVLSLLGFAVIILLLIAFIYLKKQYKEGKIFYEDVKKAKAMNIVFDLIYVVFIFSNLILETWRF
ncbi:MAG: hypothetical protein IKW90_06010 [Lachnospiraceae bacterium]|nr:hypothetical protein [Lachnospiraceae bacterium]